MPAPLFLPVMLPIWVTVWLGAFRVARGSWRFRSDDGWDEVDRNVALIWANVAVVVLNVALLVLAKLVAA